MQALLLDEHAIRALIEERRRTGGDRYDEAWDGVYVMSPLASNEHQRIASRLVQVLGLLVPDGALVLAGANVSDRLEGWEHNYRCPDVVVVLPSGRARDAGTHWVDGPDFLVEVVSPNDRSREKLEFYAAIGVRELLLIDRDSKALEIFGRDATAGNAFRLAGTSTQASPCVLASAVLPVSFSSAPDSPGVLVTHAQNGQIWRI